ncbi:MULTISPECIES: lipoate--protein ligase family protein [Aphanothece]|uniref:lipoate--protein ligase family protein n=1 Tax=Aphanothece TaxID=1121 RepID=UPI00398563A0
MASAPASPIAPARWLPTCRLGGGWQMAIDSWLLDQGRPAFRLYRWQRPTLSLGQHQHALPPHWGELARAGVIDVVRRPSGGRAVLHGGDLTYALVWPTPPASRVEAYGTACRWLQQAFERLGHPLSFGSQRAVPSNPSCFALSTAADLVESDGAKRIGSAQLWRRGRLLQHGSILLAPSAELWEKVFGDPAPRLRPLPLEGQDLETELLAAARRALPFPLQAQPEPLRAAELAAIAAGLDAQRPGSGRAVATRGWASPAETMPRTTIGRASPSG